MTPGAVLELLGAAGVSLRLEEGFLNYEGPRGAYTPALRALVTEHRNTFIQEWRCWACGAITHPLFGLGRIVTCRGCATGNKGETDGRDSAQGEPCV